MNTSGPFFVAQEALCFYPISTIYDSCPRYLFYALLLASCLTRWTGWLADVFLGAAATYAGTAAIESFILVAGRKPKPDPAPVTIPYLDNGTSLRTSFPQLVTQTDHVLIQPAALELDGDAVMAIVVTGYLVFLPLQCWSRILTHDRARNLLFGLWNILMLAGSICALVYTTSESQTPIQYMFCYPDIPPYESTTSDGWQDFWRNSTWNSSVWDTFSNITKWGQLGDICYNPCFNTSQILRQPGSLNSWVEASNEESPQGKRFWNKFIYSRRYIYSLIILCVILNIVLLTFRFLPYKSTIPSARIVVIWKERKNIWKDFKDKLGEGYYTQPSRQSQRKTRGDSRNAPASRWSRIRPIFTPRFTKAFLHVLADVAILLCLLFSMIVSPLTIIAFVVWIEWWIYNDGPSQENPQQVGQWSYLVSIALLLVSATILTLKYRLASVAELDEEIARLKTHLEKLEMRKEARMQSEVTPLTIRDGN